MEVGEKYLYIKIVGHEGITVYPNREKKEEKHPDFKTNGVGVWVRTKKEKKEETPNSIL